MRSWLVAFGGAIVLGLLASATAVGADQDGDLLNDGFEARWGTSDPAVADSDADGVIDSAEDSDGDGLSDLGEQRFGTNPGRRDSDGDGIPDGQEDKDHDGVSNAMEQDRRPVPAGLRPVLTKAGNDFPEARFSCQTGPGQSKLLPCVFGDKGSPTTIVLFGDSHAAQWLPALDRAADRSGWRVVQLTKSACPSLTVLIRSQFLYDRGVSCRRWRERAMGWLQRHSPDVIVISNHSQWTLLDSRGRKVPSPRRAQARKRALLKTLQALPAHSKAVVLSDTPRNSGDPVACLKRHRKNISACTVRRQAALFSKIRAAERGAAVAADAATRNLNDKICSYDPCPLIHGRTLLWRDRGHLTATFSRRLWPTMRDRLRTAVPGALGVQGGAR